MNCPSLVLVSSVDSTPSQRKIAHIALFEFMYTMCFEMHNIIHVVFMCQTDLLLNMTNELRSPWTYF